LLFLLLQYRVSFVERDLNVIQCLLCAGLHSVILSTY
jgi:hypothetical protein